MKLRKLEIQNIASIENAVIDFEKAPLADSNVILITGETGAGKSTILDAICLALYATTPRMTNTEMDGKWQENDTDTMAITDTCQLMRKNTTLAYARLWFLGSDGNDYCAEWHVKRKTKNLARTWSLNNLTHPEASPGVGNGAGGKTDKEIQQSIQAAVGLTFEQFCRTTMLAQGEFTRFLKCGNKKKAEILEKITNTEQYAQIGAKVYDLTHRKYEVEKDAVNPEKQEQPMPPEKRAELEEKISKIGEQLKSLNVQLDIAQKKETWLSTEKSLLGTQLKAQSSLEQSKKAMETDDFKLMLRNVTDWDSTADARTWLSAVQMAKSAIANADQTIQGLQTQYMTVLNGQEFIRQEISSISDQIKQIDEEMQAEGDKQTSLSELNKQRDEVLALLGNVRVAQSEVKTYFEKKKAKEDAQNKLNARKKEIEGKNKILEELKPKVENAKAQFEKLDLDYERMNLAVNTLSEKLRANLRIGKKCPICGQAVTSLDSVPHEQDLRDIVKDVEKKRNSAKVTFDNLNGEQSQFVVWLNQNVPLYNREVKEFNEDQSLNKAQEDALLALEKCHIAQLDEHTNEALKQVAQDAESQKRNLDTKIVRADKREKLQQTLVLKENNANAITSSIDQLVEKLPEWKVLTPQKAEELPNTLSKIQTLTTNVTTAVTNKNTAIDSLQTNRGLLDNFLREHSEMTEQRLEQLLTLKNMIGQQRQFVANANNAFANAQGALKTINGQIEDHQKVKPEISEGETVESLKDSIEKMKDQIEPLGRDSGAIEQQLKDDDKLIEKLAEYKKEFEKRNAIFERWNKLDKLIGDAHGETFRLIAQSYILANLVKAANVHMRTLTDRYILHSVPGKELIILVEDAYQGGVKRPASTISGGESFLVSLALALALSEIGQSLKVETLFIDEGFGTLSGEPLLKAINTLELLHANNNRQVCAISHREEVKERIPVQIQVNRSSQSSSSTIDVVPHI